jgi:hypothetical protein
MNKEKVATWLNALTDKQFVEFFYESLAHRHLYSSKRKHVDAHLVLANACRELEDGGQWAPWRLELMCPATDKRWADDAPLCQFGEHCGLETTSWAKRSICSICGNEVYGS